MKDLSSRWVVAALLAPVLLILGLALIGGNDSASAKAVAAGKAVVAVSFVSSFGSSEPVTSYQSVNVNVVSVRLSPSKNPGVADTDGGWVTIPVPQGIGKSAGIATVSTGNNFGYSTGVTNSVTVGEGRSEIQTRSVCAAKPRAGLQCGGSTGKALSASRTGDGHRHPRCNDAPLRSDCTVWRGLHFVSGAGLPDADHGGPSDHSYFAERY